MSTTKGSAAHASDEANERVAEAWRNNADPLNTYQLERVGPVVKVHKIDGLDDIVEYVRDESNLSNPTGEGFHGTTFFGFVNPKTSHMSLNEAILAAIARSNGVNGSEEFMHVELANRILRP